MKIDELLDRTNDFISDISVDFARLISDLSGKIMIANGDNIAEDGTVIVEDEDNEEISDEMLEKISVVEHCLFNAFGNVIHAKEALGCELSLPEVLIKNQYESEMVESLEMYREYKNAEEILNDDQEKQTE